MFENADAARCFTMLMEQMCRLIWRDEVRGTGDTERDACFGLEWIVQRGVVMTHLSSESPS